MNPTTRRLIATWIVGAVVGTQLFERSGMGPNAIVMSVAFGVAFAIVKVLIDEPEDQG